MAAYFYRWPPAVVYGMTLDELSRWVDLAGHGATLLRAERPPI